MICQRYLAIATMHGSNQYKQSVVKYYKETILFEVIYTVKSRQIARSQLFHSMRMHIARYDSYLSYQYFSLHGFM